MSTFKEIQFKNIILKVLLILCINQLICEMIQLQNAFSEMRKTTYTGRNPVNSGSIDEACVLKQIYNR